MWHTIETWASMGPCLFRHGNTATSVSALKTLIRFNGAVPFQARKYVHRAKARYELPCFNGAVPFQARKWRPVWRSCPGPVRFPLQSPPNMTSLQLYGGHVPAQSASMGPCLFRHGNITSRNDTPCACALQWGRAFSGTEIRN